MICRLAGRDWPEKGVRLAGLLCRGFFLCRSIWTAVEGFRLPKRKSGRGRAGALGFVGRGLRRL